MTDAYYENERFEKLSFFGENLNSCKFIDCDFIGCTFESCKLTECYFWECRFDGCSVTDMDFENCETKFLQLKNSVFVGVNWALLQPTGTIGSAIDAISSCRLKYNTFAQMSLKRFDFSGCTLTGSTFAECDLSESRFQNSDLSDTEFYKCDLRKTDFRGADGYRIDVLSCALKAARFSYPQAMRLLDSLDIRIV